MNHKHKLPAFFAALLAAALLLASAFPTLAAGPKHVILMIGDGMQLAHEVAGSRYLFGQDRALAMHGFPYQNYATTWDVTTYNCYAQDPKTAQGKLGKLYQEDSFDPAVGYNIKLGGNKPYPALIKSQPSALDYFLKHRRRVRSKTVPASTGSASAATALYTGRKTEAGNINYLPGDRPEGRLKTIAQQMRSQLGTAVGTVSTVRYTHATIAAVCAHNVHRRNEAPNKKAKGFKGATIAEEIITTALPEVIIGAGAPAYDRKNGKPLFFTSKLIEQAKKNFHWVERKPGEDGGKLLAQAADQAASQNQRLFGVFGSEDSHMEYHAPADKPGEPRVKKGSPENPDLAQMMLAALTVLSKNPKGFFLMGEQGDLDWANHSNNFSQMIGCVYDLDQAVKAVVAFVDRPGDQIDWGNTLLIVTSDHANSYMRLTKKLGKGDLPAQKVIGETRYGDDLWGCPNGEVAYSTDYHTNELVSVYAKGAGLDLFKDFEGKWYKGSRLLDNTQIYEVMRRFAGVKRN